MLRAFYVAPGSLPLDPQLEDVFVASMNSTRTGAGPLPGRRGHRRRPGPGMAPGERGVLNTMAPTVFDVSGIVDLPEKPPVLWIRGDADQIVSDTSVFDLAFLGSVGAVPGWPGDDAFPPQPMVTQTRSVLDRYAASGGRLPRGGAARRRATHRTWSARRSSPSRCSSTSTSPPAPANTPGEPRPRRPLSRTARGLRHRTLGALRCRSPAQLACRAALRAPQSPLRGRASSAPLTRVAAEQQAVAAGRARAP